MSNITKNTRAERLAQEAERRAKNPPVPKQETEATIQRKIVKHLEKRGALVIRVNSGFLKDAQGNFFRGASAGTSDLICLWRGRYIAIECKRPGNIATPKQQAFLNRVLAAGGLGLVATNVAMVQSFLDELEGDGHG